MKVSNVGENKTNKLKIHSTLSKNVEQNPEIVEREKRLKALRDKLKEKDSEIKSTPRSKELLNELEKFRPKTPSNFKADYN